ncbi:MAG: TIGR02652 family protein [Cyanobacteria bacterium J06598_3]
MLGSASQYPIYGPEIQCPHCRQSIPALLLTDSYLCTRHGAFEANPDSQTLVHVQSGRHWRRWEDQWYRQHTHPDGIRFEIHEELDRLYTQGFRATRVVIADRYKTLMLPYLEHGTPWQPAGGDSTGDAAEAQVAQKLPKLYGLPVTFSEAAEVDARWDIINFDLEKEPGVPAQARRFRMYE